MIPVKLKLFNFTSYGEGPPELDFTRFKLAAISGLNGAGKSSLLDAITWCLWGTSRAGDNADELIHAGAEQMQVGFSFELDQHIFTVRRKRSKKSGGSTSLEFLSNHHNLTEGTIKSTQQKIIDALHLTFETFTNSAYLRQGHADEFTTKGPTDRKRILADILDLNQYDLLEEKAKEKSKEAATKIQLLDYQLLEIAAELSQKEAREKSLSKTEGEIKRIDGQLKTVENLIKDIEEEKQAIINTIKSFEEKRLQVEQIKKELTDLKIQLELKEKAKLEFQTVLQQKETIEKQYGQLQNLQGKRQVMETVRSELIKTKDQLAQIQKTLIVRENKRLQVIKELEIEIKKFQTQNEQLQGEIDSLLQQKNICPTCKQTINEEKNKEIILANKKRVEKNKKDMADLQNKVKQYTSFVLPENIQAKVLEEQIKTLEERSKNWIIITKQINQLEKISDLFIKLQQAETGVKTHQEAILDLQRIYQSKKQQIISAEKELIDLVAYEEKLKAIKIELEAEETTKQQFTQQALQLRSELGEAKQLVSRTLQLENLHKTKEEEKQKLLEEKSGFDELALAFGKKGIQAMIIETAIPEIEEETNRLLGMLSEERMKISLLTQRETKTKLSSGEKGIVETLDIIISDEMGQRPYELFSGGESFRVNFAIRLAISKLLTHRAGAKLQFLVIDEGFGSQDSQGRTRLVEAIDAIKDDFEKILVITHIEELKEEFPVRIEVSKTAAGSTFEVVGV